MQFKDVVGQSEVKLKMTGMVNTNRIPHAMMLLGPEGNGNLPLALALAQYVQCENKQEDDSCGTCPSCLKNQKFIHPDVHFTFPVVNRKPGETPVSSDYITEWRSARHRGREQAGEYYCEGVPRDHQGHEPENIRV